MRLKLFILTYSFLTFLNIVVVCGIVKYGFFIFLSFNSVIIIIMNAYFKEPSSILASMFFHFESDNDFALRCMPILYYDIKKKYWSCGV
jgi:hypothetical protein